MMSQYDMLRGTCPKCSETLEVPAHLKQFSCLYCGARLTPDQISGHCAPVTDEAAACADYYREHILEVIINHIGIEQEMTKTGYPVAFDEFEQANEPTFRQLDRAVSAGAITLEAAADWFLDQLQQRWDAVGPQRSLRAKTMETDKYVIAVFLVPMVRRLALPVSEDYCKTLQARWVARYPKSPFYLGTYEELCGGFQKKILGLCYITTAICMQDGKPDNCPELTAFRNFRDGYLRACPDGPDLISEYYETAPWIVLRIGLSEDRDARYAAIRDQYLMPCYADLQAGDLQGCKARYTAMMRHLQKQYWS